MDGLSPSSTTSSQTQPSLSNTSASPGELSSSIQLQHFDTKAQQNNPVSSIQLQQQSHISSTQLQGQSPTSSSQLPKQSPVSNLGSAMRWKGSEDGGSEGSGSESAFSPRSNTSNDSISARVSATQLRDDVTTSNDVTHADVTKLKDEQDSLSSPSNSNLDSPDIKDDTSQKDKIKAEKEEGDSPEVEDEEADGGGVSSTQLSGKTCVVCNDKALSCNFGAITCESCKAFFRRNAHKDFSAKCEKTCDVTVETRSYCKKCRLNKCFSMGMKTNLILSDEQKRKRKQKIFENKLRRMGQTDPRYPLTMSPPRGPHPPHHAGPMMGGGEFYEQDCHPLSDAQPQPYQRMRVPHPLLLPPHLPPPPPPHMQGGGPIPPPPPGHYGAASGGGAAEMSMDTLPPGMRPPLPPQPNYDMLAAANLSPDSYMAAHTQRMRLPTIEEVAKGAGMETGLMNNACRMHSGIEAPPPTGHHSNVPNSLSTVVPPSQPPHVLSTNSPNHGGSNISVNIHNMAPHGNSISQQQHITPPLPPASLLPPPPGETSPQQHHTLQQTPSSTHSTPDEMPPLTHYADNTLRYSDPVPQQQAAPMEISDAEFTHAQQLQHLNSGSLDNAVAEQQGSSDSYGPRNMEEAQQAVRRSAKRSYDSRRTSEGSPSDGCSSPLDSVPESDHESPQQPSTSDISQGGLLATTLKVVANAKLFQAKVSDLPPPIAKPLFESVFDDPVLKVDVPSFNEVLGDLRAACLAAYDNLPENTCPSNPSYIQMFNFGEDAIRQLVILAKKLPPFQSLCRDDQICLLKGSVLHMMVLKSALSYDPEIKGWHVSDKIGKRTVVPKAVRSSQDGRVLMNHYGIITISVLVASRRDMIIIILLIVLSLLSPDKHKPAAVAAADPDELQERGKVHAAFNLYLEFLRSFVLLKYPDKPDMFDELLHSLDIVKDFSDTYINAMLKSPLSQLNPLLLEINNIMSI